jgi:hypothetical protein
MKKILFLILMSFTITTLKPEDIKLTPYQKAVAWAKNDPKKAITLIGMIFGPSLAAYGYFFHYQEILDFIGTLSYKAVETSVDISKPVINGAVNAAVDSVIEDPLLFAKISALGLGYNAIFYGLPFLLTNLIKFKLGVK